MTEELSTPFAGTPLRSVMATLLARTSVAAAAVAEKAYASKRVVQLYREFCREVPHSVMMYSVPVVERDARHMILLHFRRQGHVRDPRVIEMLIAKGYMELEETRKQWKQKGHILDLLDPGNFVGAKAAKRDVDPVLRGDFVRRFLDGSLDDDEEEFVK